MNLAVNKNTDLIEMIVKDEFSLSLAKFLNICNQYFRMSFLAKKNELQNKV